MHTAHAFAALVLLLPSQLYTCVAANHQSNMTPAERRRAEQQRAREERARKRAEERAQRQRELEERRILA